MENKEDKNESKPTQGPKQGAKAKKEKAPKAPKPPREKKEKPQRATPAHMPKVDKVANTLPPLSEDASALFTAANNLSTADIINLNAHLQIAVRRRGVAAASQLIIQGKNNPARELKVNQRVKVVSSNNPRLIGEEGTITKLQRIRCYVELDSRKGTYKEKTDGKSNKFVGDYFFISDVAPVGANVGTLQETIQRLTNPAPNVDISTIADEEEAEQAKTG